jgi:hypothetical protein
MEANGLEFKVLFHNLGWHCENHGNGHDERPVDSKPKQTPSNMTHYALMFSSNDGSEITGGRHKRRHIMNRHHVQKAMPGLQQLAFWKVKLPAPNDGVTNTRKYSGEEVQHTQYLSRHQMVVGSQFKKPIPLSAGYNMRHINLPRRGMRKLNSRSALLHFSHTSITIFVT